VSVKFSKMIMRSGKAIPSEPPSLARGKAQRQIEDAIRKMRGQVKSHEPQDHGRVSKFQAGEDYGFIKTADGRAIYFHRYSVLDNAFERLIVGSEVVEEIGEKGAQASTVRLAGKHHLP
jgi:cold shock CspA family protein